MNKFDLITLSLIALSINVVNAGESFTIEGIKNNNLNTISKTLSHVSMKQENGGIISSIPKKFDGLQMSLTGNTVDNGFVNNAKNNFGTLAISSSNKHENGIVREVKSAINSIVNSNVTEDSTACNVNSTTNNFCCGASPSNSMKKGFDSLQISSASDSNDSNNVKKSSFDNLSMTLSSGKVVAKSKNKDEFQRVNSLSIIPANNEVRVMERTNNFTIKDVQQVILDSTRFLYNNLNRFLLKNKLQYKTLKDGVSLLDKNTGKTVAEISMSRIIRLMKPIVEGTKNEFILNDRFCMNIIKQLIICGGIEENESEINNLRNGLVDNGFSKEAFKELEKIYKTLNEKVREENEIGYNKEKDRTKLNINASEKTILNNIDGLTQDEKDIIYTDIEFYLYNNANYLSNTLKVSKELIQNYLFINKEESMKSKLCKVILIAKNNNLLQDIYSSLTYNGRVVLDKILSEPASNTSKTNNSLIMMNLLSQNVTNVNIFGLNFDPSIYKQMFMMSSTMNEMNKFINNMITSSSVFVLNQCYSVLF